MDLCAEGNLENQQGSMLVCFFGVDDDDLFNIDTTQL